MVKFCNLSKSFFLGENPGFGGRGAFLEKKGERKEEEKKEGERKEGERREGEREGGGGRG